MGCFPIANSRFQMGVTIIGHIKYHNNIHFKWYTLYEKQVPRVVSDAGPCAVQASRCSVCRPIIQLG